MKLKILIVLFLWPHIQLFSQQETFNIVASASMIADIASNIADQDGSFVIHTIVPIGGDPHRYQPSPSDAQLVQKADLILINGLTFEGWISELIENSGTQAESITVTQGVDAISSSAYANSYDPHAWMDASNGIIYAKNIRDAFIKLDPAREEIYLDNFKKYELELQQLDQKITESIQSIPSAQRILITSHDAFEYYGRKYGLKLEAIMGISTEAEAQTSDIKRVSEAIRKYNVPAVFIESTINPKMLQQIAEDNQVDIGGELYADSLGDAKSPASTYIKMLEYNTQTIVAALSKTKKQSEEKEKSTKNLPTWLIILIAAIALALSPIVISKLRS